MILLDFHGANGGTGRSTREILKQLSARNLATEVMGLNRVLQTYRQKLPGVRYLTLDRPRVHPAYWQLRHQRRRHGINSAYTDLLLQTARRRSRIFDGSSRGLFIVFPQVMPPPEKETGFTIFIQDLNWLHFPGNFQNAQETDDWCRAWAARAGRIVANSEFTRDELLRHYRCPPEKVIAAPLAPFMDAGHVDDETILPRLGLSAGRFYLSPAIWGLHKGHDVLTEAMERADADPVVITCESPRHLTPHYPPEIYRYGQRLLPRWDKLIAQGKLVIAHGMSEAEIQTLRSRCKAFVLPSRFEGYGFPLAEAVFNHKPAIVSDIPAFREILRRYPQYPLAKIIPAGSSAALAAELDSAPAADDAAPPGWQSGVESAWSWKDTVDRVLQATG